MPYYFLFLQDFLSCFFSSGSRYKKEGQEKGFGKQSNLQQDFKRQSVEFDFDFLSQAVVGVLWFGISL